MPIQSYRGKTLGIKKQNRPIKLIFTQWPIPLEEVSTMILCGPTFVVSRCRTLKLPA